MALCLVVADDLTGANATGVLLKKYGFEAHTVLDAAKANEPALSSCDCMIIPTDSRGLAEEVAYDAVQKALKAAGGMHLAMYAKRIDSTLRGNLGRETDAFLDYLGPEYTAVCVPCFPSSGRVLVGGYLLVHGEPLLKTDAARDPKRPIFTSSCEKLYKQQSRYQSASLYLDAVHEGAEALCEQIREKIANGARILIFDSVSQEDMDTIADALLLSKTKFFPVDPGVFTATVARRLLPKQENRPGQRVLFAIGSVNAVARAQYYKLVNTLPCAQAIVQVERLLMDEEAAKEEIDRVSAALLDQLPGNALFVLAGNGVDITKRLDLNEYARHTRLSIDQLSEKINQGIASIVMKVLRAEPSFKAIYTTGGDITAAVNHQMGTQGLRLLDEVVPLAGYGELLGGEFHGLKFISKGGMVGDEMAMVTCANYLFDRT